MSISFLPISIITSLVLFPILLFLMHGFDSDDFLKIILLNQQKKENETQSQLISEQIKNEYYEYCVKYKKPNYLYHDLPNYFYAKN